MNSTVGTDLEPVWRRTLFSPVVDGRVTVFRWAFVIGSIAHLWLADPWRDAEWLPANVLFIIGLVLVALRGASTGFFLCALGAVIPVLWHHDQLSQSVILALMSLGAGYYTMRGAPEGVLATARGLTIVTYLAAFFHKLNGDFLSTEVSCAVYGADQLSTYWGGVVPEGFWHGQMGYAAIVAVLVVELALAVLLLIGMRWVAWPVAVAFHIPLTLTMAPAFVFVMAAGLSAFVTEDDISLVRRHARLILLSLVPGAGLTIGSLWAHGSLPELSMLPKELLLWSALVGLIGVIVVRRQLLLSDIRWPERLPAVAMVIVALYTVNVMAPYCGLKFQHSAAMLSNLRIDAGCWNHVLVPERIRLAEHYVRVDDASLIGEGKIPHYEAFLEEHLWGPTLLQYTADNWCKPSVRPIRIKGEFRGDAFLIEDLCDGPGSEIAGYTTGGWLRYQKFLKRGCPQSCLH